MPGSDVVFGSLRRVLVELGLAESDGDASIVFEHPASGALFLFRPYRPTDPVSAFDLASTRSYLAWRGLLTGDAFDRLLARNKY